MLRETTSARTVAVTLADASAVRVVVYVRVALARPGWMRCQNQVSSLVKWCENQVWDCSARTVAV